MQFNLAFGYAIIRLVLPLVLLGGKWIEWQFNVQQSK